ncbi:hypothetical protein EWM64_g9073, partial [Hericium alpestre]
LLLLFAEEPKRWKTFFTNEPNCPQFPDTEWTNVLLGKPVNLDLVLASMFNVSLESKLKERLGRVSLSLDDVAPAKVVKSQGEWMSAWTRTSEAIAFVFCHRCDELTQYSAYISSLFTSILEANHGRVLQYDRAVRLRVSSRRDLYLTDVHQFAELALLRDLGKGIPAVGGMTASARSLQPLATGHTSASNALAATSPAHVLSVSDEDYIATPRHRLGLAWALDDSYTYTLAADWSLSAPPLPSPPENEQNNVLLHHTISQHPDLFKNPCIINCDQYENFLANHPNVPFVESVCSGLREGFWPSAITDRPGYPSTWDNSHRELSSDAHRAFVEEQCQKEIDLGHFSQAWVADELYPGMYSMPIGVVPKPNSDKLRLITDHSAGKFSLNSMIPKPDFHEKVQLDNIQDLGRILLRVRHEHPGRKIVLFKSDVAEAYRQMPMHPWWQARQVVSIGNRRMVDRANVFGGCRSGNIWCAFMSLVLWIAVYICHLADLLAYSDDTFSWEFANNTSWYAPYAHFMPTKQARLLRLWDILCIPHNAPKQINGSLLPIIGFEVDANLLQITLSSDRRAALVAAIRDFITVSSGRHRRPLHHFQALAGWIQWSLNVFPLLCPGLSRLYAKTHGKTNPSAPVEVTVALRHELSWLANHIERASGVFMLKSLNWRPADADLVLYTDASLEGLAFWSPAHSLGFRAHPPNIAATIFFWETLAVVSAIDWASRLEPDRPCRLLIHCDNTNTVDLFNTLHAQPQYNSLLLYAVDRLLASGIDLHVQHLPGSSNGVADTLSCFQIDRALALHPGLSTFTFMPPLSRLGSGEQ